MSAVVGLKMKFDEQTSNERITDFLFDMVGFAAKERLAIEFYIKEWKKEFTFEGRTYTQGYLEMISPEYELKLFINDSYLLGLAEKFMVTRFEPEYDRAENRKNLIGIDRLLKFIEKQDFVKRFEIYFESLGTSYASESYVEFTEVFITVDEFLSTFLDYLESLSDDECEPIKYIFVK